MKSQSGFTSIQTYKLLTIKLLYSSLLKTYGFFSSCLICFAVYSFIFPPADAFIIYHPLEKILLFYVHLLGFYPLFMCPFFRNPSSYRVHFIGYILLIDFVYPRSFSFSRSCSLSCRKILSMLCLIIPYSLVCFLNG